ncbi:uncharacterized protein N7511_006044 [Penicillium nucicola]|uniref:uncharacterized protein n=1 Tax=Penicillium nucicola TaxID=1850975 RepID=UPI002545787E|nr:uncharacterized protein N7511_006044 [Penicillium nucicola]KAJ5757350.1 hypothetical protein N7511_006044 [Penicillium nucicola]
MPSNESSMPRLPNSMPEKALSVEAVGELLQKNMAADIPPSRDLGRFTTTNFDETAMNLMIAGGLQNQACIEEYPSLAEFEEKCIAILANLWNAQIGFFGAATTGSSEAVLLGGLTMKRQWQRNHPDSLGSRPNVIIGANAHICITKFADYFDVEARIIPVSEKSGYAFDVKALEAHLDERTIGVFLTVGSTYTGHFDPVQQVSMVLDEYEYRSGNSIPIHVDAASGGFIAPFTSSNTTFIWDFRLPRVQSINASGHKFGLTPLAVGWIVWREKSQIPQELLLESSYLRGTHSNFSLSFSRSGVPIVGQYYNFLRLGLAGYRDRTQSLFDRASRLSALLEETGFFCCLGDAHRRQSAAGYHTLCRGGDQAAAAPVLPIVVFRLTDRVRRQYPNLQLSNVSDAMQGLNFSIPNYTLHGWGAQGEDIEVIRIVIRDEMTTDLMGEVLAGIIQAVERLMDQAYLLQDS